MRLMGPLSRVNHDCSHFSAEFIPSGTLGGFKTLALRTVRAVIPGEEITVNYSTSYFGANNEDCLCASCEATGSNGWGGFGKGTTAETARTRGKSQVARQKALEHRIFTYDSILQLPQPRRPGDYDAVLQLQPRGRCIALHCRMLFTRLPPTSLCVCCREQALASLSPSTSLQRYYRAVAIDRPLLGPYHTLQPLTSGAAYLRTVQIAGWEVFPQVIRFNNQKHKVRAAREISTASEEVANLAAGATCAAAAAASPRQTGHVYVVEGDWRPAEANNLIQFRKMVTSQCTCVVLLRQQKVSPTASSLVSS
jgi:hypothetical protein